MYRVRRNEFLVQRKSNLLSELFSEFGILLSRKFRGRRDAKTSLGVPAVHVRR